MPARLLCFLETGEAAFSSRPRHRSPGLVQPGLCQRWREQIHGGSRTIARDFVRAAIPACERVQRQPRRPRRFRAATSCRAPSVKAHSGQPLINALIPNGNTARRCPLPASRHRMRSRSPATVGKMWDRRIHALLATCLRQAIVHYLFSCASCAMDAPRQRL